MEEKWLQKIYIIAMVKIIIKVKEVKNIYINNTNNYNFENNLNCTPQRKEKRNGTTKKRASVNPCLLLSIDTTSQSFR